MRSTEYTNTMFSQDMAIVNKDRKTLNTKVPIFTEFHLSGDYGKLDLKLVFGISDELGK